MKVHLIAKTGMPMIAALMEQLHLPGAYVDPLIEALNMGHAERVIMIGFKEGSVHFTEGGGDVVWLTDETETDLKEKLLTYLGEHFPESLEHLNEKQAL